MTIAKQYNKPNGKGLRRLINATLCSFRGLKFAWRYESAFRQEATLAMVLFPTTFLLANSIAHWSILIAALCILLLTELLNSAIETLADRITLENDIMIGRAKDIGSAAVVISLGFVTLLWTAAAYSKFMIQ
ncbi:MAG TPA: diacylglycerol kinase [Marinagarivorans sp.]